MSRGLEGAGAPKSVFKDLVVEKNQPFDLEKLTDRFRARPTDWTIPQAFLGVLLAAAAVDPDFTGQTSAPTIRLIAGRSRALSRLSSGELAAANDIASQRFRDRPNALEEACHTLPTDMRLPVFAHCVDIALADGELVRTEAEFLQDLVGLLDVDPDAARRVLEVLLVKAQY